MSLWITISELPSWHNCGISSRPSCRNVNTLPAQDAQILSGEIRLQSRFLTVQRTFPLIQVLSFQKMLFQVCLWGSELRIYNSSFFPSLAEFTPSFIPVLTNEDQTYITSNPGRWLGGLLLGLQYPVSLPFKCFSPNPMLGTQEVFHICKYCEDHIPQCRM